MASDPDGRVTWPTDDEMKAYADLVELRHPGIGYGIFGFLDGIVLPILNSSDSRVQNAYYNGYQGRTMISNVVFVPDGTIFFAGINHPGVSMISNLTGDL